MTAHDHESISLSLDSLINERHTLKTGSNRQPTGQGLWLGPFRGYRRGQGTEFDDLRHYSSGDDIRHIDWKASARTNTIHTRVYREERELKITLIVDFRDAMFTGSNQLQAVRVGRLSARLLWQATDGGGKIQILIVTDKGIHVGQSGTGHQSAIEGCKLIAQIFNVIQHRLEDNKFKQTDAKNELLTDETNDSPISFFPIELDKSHIGVNLDQVAEWVLQRTEKSKNILWLSTFDGCGNRFKDYLNELSIRGNQIAITIDDELINKRLGPGRYGYTDPEDSSTNGGRTKKTRIALLTKRASERVLETVSIIKQRRQTLLEESRMSIVSSDDSNNQVVGTLRHYGFLP